MPRLPSMTPAISPVVGEGVARGCAKGRQVRVVIGFDGDQFAEIHAMADRRRVSFAEAVRLLCEWGAESAGQAARAA
jgi:hypothetical protein